MGVNQSLEKDKIEMEKDKIEKDKMRKYLIRNYSVCPTLNHIISIWDFCENIKEKVKYDSTMKCDRHVIPLNILKSSVSEDSLLKISCGCTLETCEYGCIGQCEHEGAEQHKCKYCKDICSSCVGLHKFDYDFSMELLPNDHIEYRLNSSIKMPDKVIEFDEYDLLVVKEYIIRQTVSTFLTKKTEGYISTLEITSMANNDENMFRIWMEKKN
mmetsp:Transcript_23482/g.27580  ORF Transcript_23482/g.27580 Transcript_23482/m.27580 type:complete len:213 (-) Transcript_23482:47-685(-)